MEHCAKKVYEKVTQKHVQNTFGHFWERFWAFLDFWKFFDFLKTFRSLDPPWNTGQKKFFEKSTPKTCSKHNWTLLGTILSIFGLLKNFRFFENISKTRPTMEHWAKNFFEKYPQNMFKTQLDTFGKDFGHFWNFENFLKTFRKIDPPWNTGQKKIFEKKYPQNMFKTQLDTFGNDFGHFWNFEKKFLLKTFRRLDPARKTGQKKFSKKVPSKLVQNTFGHFWERFWAFLDFWNFFDFLKTFRRLDPPWNTGQKMFTKKLPQNMFNTGLDILGTILGLFGMLKVFYFKKSISKNRLSTEQWAKKNFRKNYTQYMFKTHLDTFGNDFVHFWTFENFSIFWKHFKDSTLRGTLGKKCLRKNYPKTCSIHVWTIWERFWAFSECWKFFILKKAFRRIDSPRNKGQ